MADTVSKIGFDVAQALTSLDALKKGSLDTGAALAKLAKEARGVSGTNLEKGLSRAAQIAKKSSAALKQTAAAAKEASSALERAGQKGKSSGATATLSWETFARVIQTQLILRGLNKIVQAFGEATDQAKTFGLAIAEVQTISGGALQSSQLLADQILNMGNNLGVVGAQVAEGLYQTLSNQIGSASGAMDVLVEAQKLATITGSETAAAVNAISSVLNSYNLSVSEAGRVSDTLFKTVELGRLRLEDIANVIGRVTPLTAKLGISWEETASAIATMTRQGVRADTAITQLRAVTQKLVKPTEKMVELFRRWGVEDGQQAIATFGGVTGVLKKLAKETNNNDTEMASYFNRVRAIVGQMGIMTERGQRMVDTMTEMADSAGAAADAYERFVASDAFKLQKAQAELTNEMTRFGAATLGAQTFWTQFKTVLLQDFNSIVNGLDGTTEKFLKGLQTTQSEAGKVAEAASEHVVAVTEEQLQDLLRIEQTRLAEANKIWFAAADKAEDRTKRMAAAVKANLDSMTKGISDAFQPLTDFVKNYDKDSKSLEDTLKKAKDAVADDKADDSGLSSSQQFNKKAAAAAKLANDASLKQQKALTGEQQKEADAVFKTAEAAAKKNIEFAKSLNNAFLERQAENDLKKLHKDRVSDIEAAQAGREEAAPLARQAQSVLEAELATRKQLGVEAKALAETLAQSDPGSAAFGAADDRLREVFDRLKDTSFADRKDELFESLGITKLRPELQEAVNESILNVQLNAGKAIKELQATLDAANITIKARLDPSGIKESLSEQVLGRERGAQEGLSSFIGAGLKEAKDDVKRLTKQEKDLVAQTSLVATAADGVAEAFKRANELAPKKFKLDPGSALVPGSGVTQQDIEERDAKTLAAAEAQKAYNKTVADNIAQVQAGQPLSKAQNDFLLFRTEALIKAKEANRQDTAVINASTGAVVKLSKATAELGQKKVGFDVEELKASKQLILEAAGDTGKAKEAMELLSGSSGKVALNAKSFAKAANEALGDTGGLVEGWNSVAQSTKKAADAAVLAIQRVNQARQAAASAAPAQFFGGTRYLAAGGPVGQDTVAARLSPDEFVSSGSTTRKFFSELNAMNNGVRPVYREQGGSVTTVGDVNVTVQGGDSAPQTVRDIGRGLERSIKRGLTKFN